MRSITASIALTALLLLSSGSSFAQTDSTADHDAEAARTRHTMTVITPALMQVGLQSDFFLQLADRIRLTENQRSRLEEISFDFRTFEAQCLADLNLRNAEVESLVARETVDMKVIEKIIRESAAITAEIKLRTIESLLQALATLTHEQHISIILVVSRELQTPKSSGRSDPPASGKVGT